MACLTLPELNRSRIGQNRDPNAAFAGTEPGSERYQDVGRRAAWLAARPVVAHTVEEWKMPYLTTTKPRHADRPPLRTGLVA